MLAFLCTITYQVLYSVMKSLCLRIVRLPSALRLSWCVAKPVATQRRSLPGPPCEVSCTCCHPLFESLLIIRRVRLCMSIKFPARIPQLETLLVLNSNLLTALVHAFIAFIITPAVYRSEPVRSPWQCGRLCGASPASSPCCSTTSQVRPASSTLPQARWRGFRPGTCASRL